MYELSDLDEIARRYAATLSASDDLSAEVGEDRPTATEIWYWRLEDVVWTIVSSHASRTTASRKAEGEYDHFRLYAHQDELKTKEDVEGASDDTLLEALGLPKVENWGWLLFMVRDLNWFLLIAANWGLPGMKGEYGGNRGARVFAEEAERRAQAGRYFLDLMRERGVDPLQEVRSYAATVKEEQKIGEEEFVRQLHALSEWAYFIYTCESVIIRPEAVGAAGEVQYCGSERAEYLAKIRRAAARRRAWRLKD